MSVWLTIPSAKPAAESQSCIDAWRDMGYKVAVQRDNRRDVNADLVNVVNPYAGYAIACNSLIQYVREQDPSAAWFVCAGDDIWPDWTKQADVIAAECEAYFGGTYGVMQPTGDRWGEDPNQPNHTLRGAYIDRVCASAFIGSQFVDWTYEARGPLYPGYYHMFVDEELQAVAVQLNCLWQRRDLKHVHHHWQRERRPMPEYLRYANSAQHWVEAQALFANRKQNGFPGAFPEVPVAV